jgi:hypothetical protein
MVSVGLIWAQSTSGVIGRDNGIPWRLPEDQARFKELTMGQTVVMGRLTWESLPAKVRPLPGRKNVVVTRQAEYVADGAVVVDGLDEALGGQERSDSGNDVGGQERSDSGSDAVAGFATYHVMNPYDDGIGLDEYVDWLIDAGYSIHRIADYSAWFQRFETTLRALPEQQRQASLLPLLHNYQHPEKPIRGTIAPTDRFRSAVQEAKIGPDKDIPHVSAPIIVKYIANLQLLGLL